MTRPETRYRVDVPVFLMWQDRAGTMRRLPARCLDLSASGALVEALDAMALAGKVTYTIARGRVIFEGDVRVLVVPKSSLVKSFR